LGTRRIREYFDSKRKKETLNWRNLFLGTRRIREYLDPTVEDETLNWRKLFWVHGLSENILTQKGKKKL
jgi:hypothetical protein